MPSNAFGLWKFNHLIKKTADNVKTDKKIIANSQMHYVCAVTPASPNPHFVFKQTIKKNLTTQQKHAFILVNKNEKV